MVYNEVEVADRSELRELQDERLREAVTRAYENVSLYCERMDELGVTPDSIELVPPGGVERQETGRIQRVWDHRWPARRDRRRPVVSAIPR